MSDQQRTTSVPPQTVNPAAPRRKTPLPVPGANSQRLTRVASAPTAVAPKAVAPAAVAPAAQRAQQPAPLAYAVPKKLSTDDLARNLHAPEAVQLFDFGSDLGPFQKLAGSMIIQGTTWYGKVYASPKAIYLVPVMQQRTHAGGGLLGAILSEATKNKTSAVVRTCLFSDLPEGLRKTIDPKWKGTFDKHNAIVLPKNRIAMLQIGSFNNMLKVFSGGQVFSVMPFMFTNGKVKRKLTELGYRLNVEIPEADVADAAATFAVVQPAEKRSALERALMIIAAIVVFVIFVAIKAAASGAFR